MKTTNCYKSGPFFPDGTRSIRRSLLLISLCCLTATFLRSQDLAYSSGSTGNDGALVIDAPFSAGLEGTKAAYDQARNEIVAFGGRFGTGNNDIINNTFVYDGTSWTLVVPANSPSAREDVFMAYDDTNDEIVLFGGKDSSGDRNDTWVWDGANKNWIEKAPANMPSARRRGAITFNPDSGKVFLYGGRVGNGTLDGTWEWDGANWTDLDPNDDPGPLEGPDIAYDTNISRIVLFGGFNSTPKDGIFIWDNAAQNWVELAPANKPPARVSHRMVFDPVRGELVLFGGEINNVEQNDTWTWDGADWSQEFPERSPPERDLFGMVWHNTDQLIYAIGGESVVSTNNELDDVWTWDGSSWDQELGGDFVFDLTQKVNGVFNFTTIDVSAGVNVSFRNNAAKTPVVWLASGVVNIDGNLSLDGEIGDSFSGADPGFGGAGGPGGYDGGKGGTLEDQSGTYLAHPGLGPGGGAPSPLDLTNQNGNPAGYDGVYGNPFLQPLVGGSGGSGANSRDTVSGNGGSGGGGAMGIASSRDITVNGSITAMGAFKDFSGGDGGAGSGGAILLIADRILGSGILDASGADNNGSLDATRAGGAGRIRLEAFERPLAQNATPRAIVSEPIDTRDFNTVPTLAVTSIDGEAVPQPAQGNLGATDVTFFDGSPVDIIVQAQNIADGTMVSLRITSLGVITDVAEMALTGGTATFNVAVPAGLGTGQAISDFTP